MAREIEALLFLGVADFLGDAGEVFRTQTLCPAPLFGRA
jgi:hypothetical protein